MVDWHFTHWVWVTIVGLYALKFALLAWLSPRLATLVMGLTITGLAPVAWQAGDWSDPYLWSPLAIYVGIPVHVLTVPALSFAYDAWRKARRIDQSEFVTVVRLALEFALVHVWWIAWAFAQLFFGWYWI